MGDNFKVPPGGRLEVNLHRKPRRKKAATPAPERQGILPVEDEPVRYVRRGVLELHFLDLGTRLRSLPADADLKAPRPADSAEFPEPNDEAGHFNAYTEIEFDAPAGDLSRLVRDGWVESQFDPYSFASQHVQAEIPDADQLEYDRRLLGALRDGADDPLNPLDSFKANGSGRRLPACAPFYYEKTIENSEDYDSSHSYPNEVFDFELYNADKSLKFPNTNFRESARDIRKWANDDPANPGDDIDVQAVWEGMEFLENDHWKRRKEKEKDSQERWAGHNLEDGAALETAYHELKGQSGRYQLRLDARAFFESFDTGDLENFKITREPSPDADEVEFSFSGGNLARVFMRPRLLAFGRLESWLWQRRIQFQSYRYRDEPDEPVYDHLSGNASALNVSWVATPVYHPDAEAGSYEVTLVADGSGAALSGTLNGTPVVSGEDYEDIIPGVRITPSISEAAGAGATAADTVEPNWATFSPNFETRANVVLGMFAARLPVVPRDLEDGWDSPLTWNGEGAYSLTDELTGAAISYDPNIAVLHAGRTVFLRHEDFGAWYEAHPSRELSRLVFNVEQMWGRPAWAVGSLTLAEARAVAGSQSVPEYFPEAEAAPASLASRAEADAAEVIAALEAFEQIRNVAFHSSPATIALTASENVIAVPPRSSPAGALVGIIEQGATFYVWRRTPLDSEAFDLDRDQALLEIEGN